MRSPSDVTTPTVILKRNNVRLDPAV